MKKLYVVAVLAALASAPAFPAFAQVPLDPDRGDTPTTYGSPEDPESSTSTYSCSDELGYLRRVYAGELAPVQDPTQVWVTPICVGDSMFRTDGNAGSIRSAIASNDAMLEALQRKAFTPENVVGVRMIGEDKVTLYVHPDR
ncbi:MAG TPA: hypothetical protein VGN80_07385 [Devosiaceae bacterium]|nr:hypothetical protein [Devosiaceae bacterium]